VLYSSQDHLGTRTCDLDHPILVGAKNTDMCSALGVCRVDDLGVHTVIVQQCDGN
jgi:hypothetical protein